MYLYRTARVYFFPNPTNLISISIHRGSLTLQSGTRWLWERGLLNHRGLGEYHLQNYPRYHPQYHLVTHCQNHHQNHCVNHPQCHRDYHHRNALRSHSKRFFARRNVSQNGLVDRYASSHAATKIRPKTRQMVFLSSCPCLYVL